MRVTPGMDTLNSFEICPNAPVDSMISTYPAVCYNDENYVVVWSDEKFGSYYIAVARVTPGGVVLDTGECISTGTGGSEYRAKIAYDGNRCLAVWPKSGVGIEARFINSAGQPEGSVLTITSTGTGGPNIAFDGTNYLVVWFTGTYPALELYGHLVSPQGSLVGSEIDIALGSGCHRWADIGFDGTNYLVAWQTGDNTGGQEIWGQFIDTNGALIGPNFMISDNPSNRRWWPAVAVSDSNYLVAWGQGASSDVYGNVDVTPVAVQEYDLTRKTGGSFSGPTIFSGSLNFLKEKEYRVYDISGRKVEPDRLKPGVYFLVSDDCLGQKVVKIR